MANKTTNPYMNVVKFYKKNFTQASQYLSKFMDFFPFYDTIYEEQEKVMFCQPWTPEDPLRLQFKANYQPITLKIFDCSGNIVDTQQLDRMQEDVNDPGVFIFQSDYDFAALTPGYYIFELHFGNNTPADLIFQSEPQRIMSVTDAKDTLAIEFSNYEKKDGIYFQSPFSPLMRVPGRLRYEKPGSKDTWFEDQFLNPTMVQSLAFDVFKLIIGNETGVPNWVIQKVARMAKCSDFKIDGILFTAATEGQEWEVNEVEFYPLKGWSLDVRPKLNKGGTDYVTEVAQIGNNSIIGVTDTKGFGFDDAGGDFTEFIYAQ